MTISTELYRSLGAASDLPDDEVNRYYLGDLRQPVAVARVRGRLYAFDDRCPCGDDEPAALSAGWHAGTWIMCRRHRSQFDFATARVLQGPATRGITTFEVREQAGEIQVRI